MCVCRRDGKECVHTSARTYEQVQSRKAESFIATQSHQDHTHTSLPPAFKAEVIGTFKECLSRQVSDGVHIRSWE